MVKKGYCVPVEARDGQTRGGTGWYRIAVAALLASPSMRVVVGYLHTIVPTSIAVGDLSRTLGRRPMSDSKGGGLHSSGFSRSRENDGLTGQGFDCERELSTGKCMTT